MKETALAAKAKNFDVSLSALEKLKMNFLQGIQIQSEVTPVSCISHRKSRSYVEIVNEVQYEHLSTGQRVTVESDVFNETCRPKDDFKLFETDSKQASSKNEIAELIKEYKKSKKTKKPKKKHSTKMSKAVRIPSVLDSFAEIDKSDGKTVREKRLNSIRYLVNNTGKVLRIAMNERGSSNGLGSESSKQPSRRLSTKKKIKTSMRISRNIEIPRNNSHVELLKQRSLRAPKLSKQFKKKHKRSNDTSSVKRVEFVEPKSSNRNDFPIEEEFVREKLVRRKSSLF